MRAVSGPVMMLNGPDTTPLWERCDCACKHHYVPFCKDSTVTMSTSFLLPDFWYKGLRRLQKWTQRNLPRKEQADGSGEMAQWLRVPLLMQPGRRSLLDMGCSLESPPPPPPPLLPPPTSSISCLPFSLLHFHKPCSSQSSKERTTRDVPFAVSQVLITECPLSSQSIVQCLHQV